MKTIEATAKGWHEISKEYPTEALPLAAVAVSLDELRIIALALREYNTSPRLLVDVNAVIAEVEKAQR